MKLDETFSADEIAQLRKLLEIEKIRKKKNLYSHYMDALDHKSFSDLYTEDAICEWGPNGSWVGNEKVREKIGLFHGGRIPFYSMHRTTNIWIELTSDTTAASRSYVHIVRNETDQRINPTAFFGVYEEKWVKIDGDWKISRQDVQFLWPHRTASDLFPQPMISAAAI